MRVLTPLLIALGALSPLTPLNAGEAFGFGSTSRGGTGGKVLMVTRLDDDLARPQPGMLRWALSQDGPRIIRFALAGTISLKDRIIVRQGQVTIDGRDAPEQGICIRGGSLEFDRCSDVILRYFRVRLGDETTLAKNRRAHLKRPKNSNGLDCINLSECQRVLLDHLSLSWCCDELLSVVRCQGVTAQWCLFSEPLSNAKVHPYGDHHAYCLNASASTLTVHHCLFARYVMRGPQFEANDMRKADKWAVKMEAISNVMFDYERSGSRYTAGIEDHQKEAVGKSFQFQFLGNEYLDHDGPQKPVEIVLKHGIASNVRVGIDGNRTTQFDGITPSSRLCVTEHGEALDKAPTSAQRQIQSKRLFTSPNPPPADIIIDHLPTFLAYVGCSHARDSVDQRIISDVQRDKQHDPIKSQDSVGGWPALDGRGIEPRPLADRLLQR